ncbi:MAG: hypothetical protein QXM79_07705 [Zestosphaera sp.]
MFRLTTLALVVFAGLLITSLPACLAQEDLLSEVESIMKDLEYLHSRGVDVGLVVDLLNRAISEYFGGDVRVARTHLEEARRAVEDLKAGAESTYFRIIAVKTATVACLASIPLVVYFALPRLYLYLWFKLHRKWVVRW